MKHISVFVVLLMVISSLPLFAEIRKNSGFIIGGVDASLNYLTSEGDSTSTFNFEIDLGGGYQVSEAFSIGAYIGLGSRSDTFAFKFVPELKFYSKINDNIYWTPKFNIGIGSVQKAFMISPELWLLSFDAFMSENFAFSFSTGVVGYNNLSQSGISVGNFFVQLSSAQLMAKYVI